MKSGIKIQEVSESSVTQLRNISIETFYEAFIWGNTEENMQHYINNYFSVEQLTRELRNPNSVFYFAVDEGEVIGYLKINSGDAQSEMRSANGLEIERIYVKKDHRGKKTGQLLFDHALMVAKDKAADFLWLGVWEKNPGAIRFYERNGMVRFSSHTFKLGNDMQTDILMRREI